jgi:hypothetical protein
VRWPVGLTEKDESLIVLGDSGKIMQNSFETSFFAQAPQSTGDGHFLLTVCIGANQSVDLVATSDYKSSRLIASFPAGNGSIEEVEVNAGSGAEFYSLNVTK